MYTFKQIVDSLPVKKNSKSSWWVKLWVRKSSFIFTWIFINLGFSSNQVSYLSILVSVAACVCLSLPSKEAVLIGVILINLWLILDCVDGNIARCKKQKKIYGEFIDAMSGYYTVGFIYMALGITAYNLGGLLFEENNLLVLLLGAISSISDVLARLIYTNFCSAQCVNTQEVAEKQKTDQKGTINYLRKRVSKELGISGLFMPFVILSFIFNIYDLIVLFYFIFNLFALLSTTVIYGYKANHADL